MTYSEESDCAKTKGDIENDGVEDVSSEVETEGARGNMPVEEPSLGSAKEPEPTVLAKEREGECLQKMQAVRDQIFVAMAGKFNENCDYYQNLLKSMEGINNGVIRKQLRDPDLLNQLIVALPPGMLGVPAEHYQGLREVILKALFISKTKLGELLEKSQQILKGVDSTCSNKKEAMDMIMDIQPKMSEGSLDRTLLELDYAYHHLNASLATIRDEYWYEELALVTSEGSATTKADAKSNDPSPRNSKNDRIRICNDIIVASEKKILQTLLDQFNEIYKELTQVHETSWAFTKNLMSKLLIGHRDAAVSSRRHARFNKMPKDINPFKLSEVIDELNIAIKEIFLDLDDVQQVFINWKKESLQADNVKITPEQYKREIELPQILWRYNAIESKCFDVRVNVEKGIVQRFKAEIAALKKGTKISWDTKEQAEKEKSERDQLIQDLIAADRQKCAAMNCPCIEKERSENAKHDGFGTWDRIMTDWKKAEQVVDGTEVWKEAREQQKKMFKEYFEKRARQAEEDHDHDEELAEAMQAQHLDLD